MNRGMNIPFDWKQSGDVREASKRYYSLRLSAEEKLHKLRIRLLRQWGRK